MQSIASNQKESGFNRDPRCSRSKRRELTFEVMHIHSLVSSCIPPFIVLHEGKYICILLNSLVFAPNKSADVKHQLPPTLLSSSVMLCCSDSTSAAFRIRSTYSDLSTFPSFISTGWHNCKWGIKPPVQTAVLSLWCKELKLKGLYDHVWSQELKQEWILCNSCFNSLSFFSSLVIGKMVDVRQTITHPASLSWWSLACQAFAWSSCGDSALWGGRWRKRSKMKSGTFLWLILDYISLLNQSKSDSYYIWHPDPSNFSNTATCVLCFCQGCAQLFTGWVGLWAAISQSCMTRLQNMDETPNNVNPGLINPSIV